MLFSHQLDVIEDVIDVVVDRLDVDAVPIAHSMSNCVDSQQKNIEESHFSITRRQKVYCVQLNVMQISVSLFLSFPFGRHP